MANMEATVKVHVHIDIDGKPVTTFMADPATAVLHEHGEGLAVYLHLDGAKLAHALVPHIARNISTALRIATYTETEEGAGNGN